MAMNAFRAIGDFSHVASILVFLHIVFMKGNAMGVSRKAQKLYLLVFLSRYLDIFTTYYSFYNSAVKIFFLVSTAAILYGLRYVEPAKSTYSASQDRFVYWHALVPAGVVAFLVHFLGSGVSVEISDGGLEMHYSVHIDGHFDVVELLWKFSICLEPMAMLPQLAIFYRNRNLNTELCVGIGCMGVYRFLYILNWVYRAHHEPHYKHHVLVYTAGVLQVLFYSDFFYYQSRFLSLQRLQYQSDLVDNVTAEASAPLISDYPLATGAESELVGRNMEKMDDAHTDASNPERPPNDVYSSLQVV